MRYRKRIVCLISAFLLLCVLSGCDEDTDPTKATPQPTPAAPTESVPRPTPAAPTETTAPTEPSATQPPATEPPATQPPATEPPATQPPATEPTHTHTYIEAVTAPTCTEKGYTTFTCSCGDTYTGNETAATGHTWGEWTTVKEATFDAEGQAQRSCSACSQTESKALDKLVYTPPTVTVTQTSHQATSLYNKDGYAIVKIAGDWEGSSYILDKTGKVVFGPVDYWGYSLSYDSGIVLIETGTRIGDVMLPYYLDGTPVPLDQLLPSEDMNAFVAQFENDPAYSKVEKNVYYQVESLYNGMMTVRRRCSVDCYVGDKRDERQTLVQSFVVSVDGSKCLQLPELFNIEYGAGSGGYLYIGNTGGYSDSGLMWFWHWDKLEGSIFDLKDSSFSYEALYGGSHFYPAGYMDLQGNVVIPAVYDTVWAFSEDVAAVKTQDGKVGFIDSAGNTVIPFEYTDAKNFCGGYAAVKKDGKWGYIDQKNNIVLPFVYDGAFGAAEGLMTVGQGGKYGLADKMGNLIVPMEYDDISIAQGGIAYAIKDGHICIIEIQ